jgi:hypothetical protein
MCSAGRPNPNRRRLRSACGRAKHNRRNIRACAPRLTPAARGRRTHAVGRCQRFAPRRIAEHRGASRAEQSGSGRRLKGLGFKVSGLVARDFAAGTSLAEASIRTARLRRRRPRPRRPRRRRPVMRGPRQVTIGSACSAPCTAPLRAAPSGWWCAARSWAAHAALPGPESAAHRPGPYAFEPSCYYE